MPSGASTGAFEALELRDGDSSVYGGKGVMKAVANVEDELAGVLVGKRRRLDQAMIDRTMIEFDGTPNKARLGANAILGCSLAVAAAAAEDAGLPLYRYLGGARANRLPVPMMNILNGGAHADNSVDLQEFMVAPIGARTFADAVRMGAEIYGQLKKVLRGRGLATGVGDEGGFAPDLDSRTRTALDGDHGGDRRRRVHARRQTSPSRSTPPRPSSTATAPTTSTARAGRSTAAGMVDYWADLVERYPIISIEDGMAEEDWDGWVALTERLGDRRCSSSATTSSSPTSTRLQKGIDLGAGNALLVKVNQIGTLSETLAAMDLASRSGYASMVSHRSGETEDTFIADLAVATGAGQIKTGRAVAQRARGQVQPADPDRGAARPRRVVPGTVGLPRVRDREAGTGPGAAYPEGTGPTARADLPGRIAINATAHLHRGSPDGAPARLRRAGVGVSRASVRSSATSSAKLEVLEQRRETLRRQIADLNKADVLEARARAIGLVKPGERAFLVRGDLEPAPAADEGDADDGGPIGWLTGIF